MYIHVCIYICIYKTYYIIYKKQTLFIIHSLKISVDGSGANELEFV